MYGCYYHLARDKSSWPNTALEAFPLPLPLLVFPKYVWQWLRVGYAQTTFHNSDSDQACHPLAALLPSTPHTEFFRILLHSWAHFHNSLSHMTHAFCFPLCITDTLSCVMSSLIKDTPLFAGLCHWHYFPTLWAIHESDPPMTFQNLCSARREILCQPAGPPLQVVLRSTGWGVWRFSTDSLLIMHFKSAWRGLGLILPFLTQDSFQTRFLCSFFWLALEDLRWVFYSIT